MEASLPKRHTPLTDKEVLQVIESGLPSAERYAVYPADFVQKGFPRKERRHKDPPPLRS